MTRYLANARLGRLAAAAVLLAAAAACSADPGSSFSPNLAIDRPTGYPEGASANCDGQQLTEELSRFCWTGEGATGGTILDPLTQAMVCACTYGPQP